MTSARCRICSAASCIAARRVVPPEGRMPAIWSSTRPRCGAPPPGRESPACPYPAMLHKPTASPCCAAREAERARQSPRVVEPCGARGSKIHRPAGVDEQDQPQVRVRLELLYIKAVAPAPGPPIQPPRIVAGYIFPILGKFQRESCAPGCGACRTRCPAWPCRACSGSGRRRASTVGSRKGSFAVRHFPVVFADQAARLEFSRRGAWLGRGLSLPRSQR